MKNKPLRASQSRQSAAATSRKGDVPEKQSQSRTEPQSVAFTYEGRIPSKGNYRWNQRGRDRWKRVKDTEREIAWLAKAAGAKNREEPAEVYILARNQACDLDSTLKLTLDALKGVAFVDDDPDHLVAIHIASCQKKEPGLDVTVRYTSHDIVRQA